MTAREPAAERLRHARAHVRAVVESPGGAEPAVVTSATPIRALPDDVGAVVVARAQAGLAPAGADFPRNPLLKRVAVPCAVLTLLGLVLLVVALVAGSGTLTIVAFVALAVLGAATVAVVRYAAADPLRLGPREQSAIRDAGRWSPSRDWSGGRAATHDGALLAAATDAAQRIVDSAAWRSGALARCGVVLSLAAELDQVETQAARAAADDPAWNRLLTRVAALTAYADSVETLPDSELEPDDVELLAFFLSAEIYETT